MNLHNLIDRSLLIGNLERLEGLNEAQVRWFIEYLEMFPRVDIIRMMENILEEQREMERKSE